MSRRVALLLAVALPVLAPVRAQAPSSPATPPATRESAPASPRQAAPAQAPAPARSSPGSGDGAQAAVELPAVRVIGRREDPFAFRNPVEAEGTVFERGWDEPPSLEEIGLRGGLVQMAIAKGLEMAAKGVRKLPGWQNQIVDATARPPPLDEAQLARAARLRDGADGGPPPEE